MPDGHLVGNLDSMVRAQFSLRRTLSRISVVRPVWRLPSKITGFDGFMTPEAGLAQIGSHSFLFCFHNFARKQGFD